MKFDDKYWICHTNSTGTFFTILYSMNLSEWYKGVDVSMTGIASVFRVWSPEWFLDSDNSVHIFAACSTGTSTSNFQIFEVHPLLWK